jgi:hypothetical protein
MAVYSDNHIHQRKMGKMQSYYILNHVVHILATSF